MPLTLLVQTASFSLMSLLPRRDPSAVWAIKQHEHSHFLFITTDCYLSFQPSLSSLHAFLLKISPLLSNGCYNGCVSLISCWGGEQKNTFCTQTICRDVHTDLHSIHTCWHAYLHKHWQNTARAQSALCSHTGHCNVTRRVSFCHPLINNGKILIRIFNSFPGKCFLSVCYITQRILTRDKQNEPCARSICLFLCRSTANVH